MAYIKAISIFSPPYNSHKVVTNSELQDDFEESVIDIEKIAKRVGVDRRYVAGTNETATDLAYEAAIRLFKEWRIDCKSIDFIIFSTQCPDYFLPSSACVIQHRLGIPTTAGAFDYDLGCSGFAYGLAIAKSFVDSGYAHNVLLLTGDTLTKYLHPSDKNRVLFGDGATATIISI